MPVNSAVIIPRRRLIDIQQLLRPEQGPTERAPPTNPIPAQDLLPLPRSQAPKMKPTLAPSTNHGPTPNLQLPTNPAREGPTDPRLARERRRRRLLWREVAMKLRCEGIRLGGRIARVFGERRGRGLVEVDGESGLVDWDGIAVHRRARVRVWEAVAF